MNLFILFFLFLYLTLIRLTSVAAISTSGTLLDDFSYGSNFRYHISQNTTMVAEFWDFRNFYRLVEAFHFDSTHILSGIGFAKSTSINISRETNFFFQSYIINLNRSSNSFPNSYNHFLIPVFQSQIR